MIPQKIMSFPFILQEFQTLKQGRRLKITKNRTCISTHYHKEESCRTISNYELRFQTLSQSVAKTYITLLCIMMIHLDGKYGCKIK